MEEDISRLRGEGIKIVRWSPAQRYFPGYVGSDDIIRAAKDPKEWQGWTGNDQRIVSFANDVPNRRDTLAFDFWEKCAEDMPIELYGLRNDGIARWHGTATAEEQLNLLRSARATLVTGSRPAPYNLSFIEAWMLGTPVVHIGRQVGSAVEDGCYELNQLIRHGVDGFIVNDVSEAREILMRLLRDHDYAKAISARGRESAIRLFGIDVIRQKWASFFASLSAT